MSVSYSQALKAFQNGKGTPVRTGSEQKRIILSIPELNAPPIRMPVSNAPINGVVSDEHLSDTLMQSRHGPVEGNGIVFRNIAENNGEGIWQSVHTDGNGVIIFNNATIEDFQQIEEFVATRLSVDNNTLSLESLDAILTFATQIGLTDRYNSTKQHIKDHFENIPETFPLLSMPVKKPLYTKALFVPQDTPLQWNPNGDIMETYTNGSFLTVSKTNQDGTPTELIHLNPNDAEGKYYLMNGDPVKLTDTHSPNIQVFSPRVIASTRPEATHTPPPL